MFFCNFDFSICLTSVACQTNDESFDAQLKQCVELTHNDINDGVVCLEKLLESNPDRGIIYSFLADDYRQLGQIDKAEQAIKTFIQSYPLDAAGRESFCKILMKKGDLINAAAECMRAIQLQPKDILIRITTATVQEKMGKLKEAESSYKYALDISPNDKAVLLFLGSFYERAGELDKAIETLEKLVGLKPDNYEKIEEGIKKLKEKRKFQKPTEKPQAKSKTSGQG